MTVSPFRSRNTTAGWALAVLPLIVLSACAAQPSSSTAPRTAPRTAARTAAQQSATGGQTRHPTPASPPSSAAPTDPTQRTRADYRALILHDGQSVTATGEVVSVPGHPVRWCAPAAEAATGTAGPPQPAKYCPIGVDLHGANLDQLTGRLAVGGTIAGTARISGRYAAGAVTVTSQSRVPAYGLVPSSRFDIPPCPAPAGGWPRGGPINLADDLRAATSYQERHPADVVQVAILRPSRTAVVAYVLTAGHPSAADAALRPTYGDRLCTHTSPYSRAEIDSAQKAFAPPTEGAFPGSGLYATGQGLTRDGSPVIDVQLAFVTEQLARIAESQPRGLVELNAWLVPD
ncbi:hypothetical protein M6D93_00380 [Jatrophihabitans telluris]|uniref:LigA protein n=1 Tax=Jatrophihabitans telluris TaxID=2038343 RepID=A0ABY4QZ39_9ACTN|nr:hypothetical protein [Jatrophihabitans telluris]UQX88477.1 hypothetical protein M6D93_00380 [Jatrophihabitans telluris]